MSTFWKQPGGRWDPDQYRNTDSNPRSLLVEATRVQSALDVGGSLL